MSKNIHLVSALLLTAGVMATAATGCELITSVDRSLIGSTGGAGGGTTSSATTGTGGAASTSGAGGAGGGAASSSSGVGGAGGASASSSSASSSSASSSSASSSSAASSSASSSSAASSSAASSSSSGVVCPGGAMSCGTAANCPVSASDCVTATCDNSCCGTTNVAAGSACNTNGGHVCNGAGTCVGCVTATDCPASANECAIPACVASACTTTNLDSTHVATMGQTLGDCQKLVCNGAGGTTSANDATDVPVSSTVCLTMPTCGGAPLAPSFTPAATGTDCSADGQQPKHVCGDTSVPTVAGTCVQCNTGADCPATNDAGPAVCANHVCL